MNTNGHEFILKEEVYQVINAALEVINTLGHGLFEKVYENALCVEFSNRNITYIQQKQFVVLYKGTEVGNYISDIIAFEKIIIELKTIDSITNHERGQILNYLRISGCKVGLILNFKKAKLEWERLIL